MSIDNLIATRNSRYAASTDPTEILLMALGEIQAELSRLSVSVTVPDIDFSPLEKAISKLTPLPPQDLDLNPVYRSYEDTAKAIKELLGEVKTTNHRLMGTSRGGGGATGPTVMGIHDLASGARLKVNDDGSITTNAGPTIGGATEATALDIKRAITDQETRLDYAERTDGNPVYVGKNTNGVLSSHASWTIQKLTYDGSSRLTRAQVLAAVAWDDRATLGW